MLPMSDKLSPNTTNRLGVSATASARHHDFLRELGVETAIDYRTTRFEEVLRDMDIVLDTVGGDTLERSWRVLRRGGTLVLVARFVPGGRTATTFTCGLTRFSWWRFAFFAAIAAAGWATYGALLGYFGGQVFSDHPLLALAVALGIAFAITLAAEAIRRLRERA